MKIEILTPIGTTWINVRIVDDTAYDKRGNEYIIKERRIDGDLWERRGK